MDASGPIRVRNGAVVERIQQGLLCTPTELRRLLRVDAQEDILMPRVGPHGGQVDEQTVRTVNAVDLPVVWQPIAVRIARCWGLAAEAARTGVELKGVENVVVGVFRPNGRLARSRKSQVIAL